MNTENSVYIIDSNIFIEASRRYYPFDIAPAFWEFIAENVRNNKIIIIDRVYDEIVKGKDVLANWMDEQFASLITGTKDDENILRKYSELMNWANNQNQYSQNAKDEFAEVQNADPWIIATANVYNYVIVTHEVFDSTIKKKIPIPNVCKAFKINYMNTFDLLRELNFRF